MVALHFMHYNFKQAEIEKSFNHVVRAFVRNSLGSSKHQGGRIRVL